MSKFPSSILVRNFYAYFLALQNKNLILAQKISKLTLTEDNENPAYLDTYGLILFKLGKFEESGEYLKKAYDKLPFEPEIIKHLVEYYKQKNDKTKIIEIYKKAIANDVDFKKQLLKKLSHVEQDKI